MPRAFDIRQAGARGWRVVVVGLLLAVAASMAGAAPRPATAAGVVGNGTAESCTEAAFDAALAGGGVITFNCGDYAPVIPLTTEKRISSETHIDGTGSRIILRGNGSTRLFYVDSGVTFRLTSITLSNGFGSHGGAIYNNQGTLVIADSVFKYHRARSGYYGGAIYSYKGNLSIVRSTFTNNWAQFGGALYLRRPTTALIQDTDIRANMAGTGGGGMEINGGSLTIERSSFTLNQARKYAGGLYVYSSASLVNMTTSTVSGNTATDSYAGGVYNYQGRLEIAFSTLNNNSAPGGGGGLRSSGSYASTTIVGSIVANSPSGGDCNGTVTSQGYNIASDLTCGFTQLGDRQNTDPKLNPALWHYGGETLVHQLLKGSPAINTGPASCPSPDQRGFPRPTGGFCEIGSYEVKAGS